MNLKMYIPFTTIVVKMFNVNNIRLYVSVPINNRHLAYYSNVILRKQYILFYVLTKLNLKRC